MYKLDVSDLVTGDLLLELLSISHRFDLDFHEDLCLLLRSKWLEWDGFHVVYSAAQEFCDVKLQETCLLFCFEKFSELFSRPIPQIDRPLTEKILHFVINRFVDSMDSEIETQSLLLV